MNNSIEKNKIKSTATLLRDIVADGVTRIAPLGSSLFLESSLLGLSVCSACLYWSRFCLFHIPQSSGEMIIFFLLWQIIQDEAKSAILLDKIFTIAIYLTSIIKLIIILLYLI